MKCRLLTFFQKIPVARHGKPTTWKAGAAGFL